MEKWNFPTIWRNGQSVHLRWAEKNWMFCKTPRGAQASAIWYSIVVTAKENELIPFEYIKYVLESLRGKNVSEMPGEDIDRLLPWSDKLPENCYQPSSEQK